MLNGQLLSITRGLATAIRYLRDTKATRTFWIDQIAINQADHDERAQQVTLMAKIYGEASRVVLWLGDEAGSDVAGDSAAETKGAFTLMRHLLDTMLPRGVYRQYGQDYDPGYIYDEIAPDRVKPAGSSTVHDLAVRRLHIDDLPMHGLPARDDQRWRMLANLFSRPWFSRVWVIQEAIMAKAETTVVQCGHETITWKDLVKVAQVAYVYLPRLLLGMELALQGWPIEHVRDFHKIKKARKHGVDPGLNTLVLRHKMYKATNPRDKLYAMLNMTTAWSGTVNYTVGVDKLSHALAYDLIKRYVMIDEDPASADIGMLETYFPEMPHTRRGSLMAIMCSAGTANQHMKLPSWVPDLSVDSLPLPIWKRKRRGWTPMGGEHVTPLEFQDHSSSKPAGPELPQKLCLEGYVLDIVRQVGSSVINIDTPLERTDQQQKLATWFLEASQMCASVQVKDRISPSTDEEMASLLCMGNLEEFFSIDELEGIDSAHIGLLRFSRDGLFKSQMCHRLHGLDYLRAIPNIRGRVIFTTENKLIGFASPGIRVGDEAVLFAGFDVPLILHPTVDGTHSLVSECYLDLTTRKPSMSGARVPRPTMLPDRPVSRFVIG